MKQPISSLPCTSSLQQSKLKTLFYRIAFTNRFNNSLQKHLGKTKPKFVFRMSTDRMGYLKIGELLKSNIIYVTAANGENFKQAEMVELSNYLIQNLQLQKQLQNLNWETILILSKKPLLPLKCEIA